MQNTEPTENIKISTIKSLILELEIKGAKKASYLRLAKSNPDLVIEQLEAFKQYKADFNSERIQISLINHNEF